MNATKSKLIFHLIAIATVAIWGTTFVSTKILIQHGLTPSEIFFYRFVLAYICMWNISRKKLFANRIKDELLLFLAGLCGGTIYFLTENTALGITLASNVSLIVCTSPILTTFLSYLFKRKEPFTRHLLYGSFMALIGVGLVVFNGSFILKINPLGDFLSLTAALMWAFYCLILKQLDSRYSTVFITRKVFFYGIMTTLPVFLFRPLHWDTSLMLQPVVWGNLLFLGIIASMLCFISWNACVKELGAVQSTNYIYIVPLVTLLTSAIIIDEKITVIALSGCFLILCGVYLAERKISFTFSTKTKVYE